MSMLDAEEDPNADVADTVALEMTETLSKTTTIETSNPP